MLSRGLRRAPRNVGGGQVEKGRNFIRLEDELIFEHKDGLMGILMERFNKVEQKATQEEIWLG
jgi:hypothetical protein